MTPQYRSTCVPGPGLVFQVNSLGKGWGYKRPITAKREPVDELNVCLRKSRQCIMVPAIRLYLCLWVPVIC